MSVDLARQRLAKERKDWRKNHPVGFYARPETQPDGSVNLFRWDCGIPGPDNTPWEGGIYKLKVIFSNNYPIQPPEFRFEPPIFHPNVFKSGHICLSILKSEKNYSAGLTIPQLLLGIQKLLVEPNIADPANREASDMYRNARQYNTKIRAQARKFAEADEN